MEPSKVERLAMKRDLTRGKHALLSNGKIPVSRKALKNLTAAFHDVRWRSLPYAVYVNGLLAGRFDDLRDAIASARITKGERPIAKVAVIDAMTGGLMIEIEL